MRDSELCVCRDVQGESSTPEPRGHREEPCHENGLSQSLSDSDTEHLSGSLEAEHRRVSTHTASHTTQASQHTRSLTHKQHRRVSTHTPSHTHNAFWLSLLLYGVTHTH